MKPFTRPSRRRRRRPRKPMQRPKPHIATLATAVIVLVSFTIIARGTVLPSHHQDLFAPPHDNHHPTFPRPAVRDPVDIHPPLAPPPFNHSLIHNFVAADGSVFRVVVDDLLFSVVDTGVKHDLSVNDVPFPGNGREATIAFFMQISEANLPLLPRLMVVMWHPKNVYVLHLDLKIPVEKAERAKSAIRAVGKFSNVHFLPREPITYKGVSMLLNTLSAIEFLLQGHEWDYFVNLSGSDYPLVNIGSMRRILGEEHILGKKISFLQLANDKRFWEKMKRARFDFVYYDTSLGMKRDVKHELIHTWVPHPIMHDVGITFVQAEAWITAHRSFAEFAARSSFARKLLVLLSTMQDPEEHFFGMLAWNTPQFNKTLAHHAFRGIYWEFNRTMSGQHPYYVDQQRDGTFPFYESRILDSRCFFARKFRDPTSGLLDRIDRSMSGTHTQSEANAVSKSLLHVRSFVSCIADVAQIKDRIREYASCWRPSSS